MAAHSTTSWGFVCLLLMSAWPACATAQEDQSLEEEARGLFEAGSSAYSGGRYEEAVGHFQRSYELSGRPELLYNIATAAERARQDEAALRAYEQFLERVPDTDRRAQVETRIRFLRGQLDRGEGPGEPGQPVASGDVGAAPWILAGGGAALAVVGAIVLGVGMSDRALVEDPEPGAMWTDAQQAAYDRAPGLLTSGLVLLPAGVLLAAVGLVWALAAPGGSAERVALRVGPGSLVLAGGF
jgi:tetratricopeptide (TPR) repeat protein